MSATAAPRRYRPCAGALVFNPDGLVWLGHRADTKRHSDSAQQWQLPQGGIDAGETPYEAVLRELYEETSMRSVRLIEEAPEWLSYDLPVDVLGRAFKGRYCGQRQKWFALRFEGDEAEIDVRNPGGGGHKPEFDAWRWARLEELPDLVIPFKRPVYAELARLFRHLAA